MTPKLPTAWAVVDKTHVIEVSLDKNNLPDCGQGEKLIKVRLVKM